MRKLLVVGNTNRSDLIEELMKTGAAVCLWNTFDRAQFEELLDAFSPTAIVFLELRNKKDRDGLHVLLDDTTLSTKKIPSLVVGILSWHRYQRLKHPEIYISPVISLEELLEWVEHVHASQS